MSIEVGDAVLKFVGDSTDLDTQFDQVLPNAKAAFEPAAEVVEEASDRMTHSMGEARGEAALLGEAIGIRLPRHVRSFVAELPGVGEALTAAFSATAVLFLIQALVEGTEKLTEWIDKTFIYTDAMREANAEISESNQRLLTLSKIYADAKNRLDELTGATKNQTDAQTELIQSTIAQAKAELDALKASIANKTGWDKLRDSAKDYAGVVVSSIIPGYGRLSSAVQDYLKIQEKEEELTTLNAKAQKAQAEVDLKNKEEQRQAALRNQLVELENEKKVALAYAQTEEQKYEVTQQFEERRLGLLRSIGATEVAQQRALMADIEAQQIIHEQKLSATYAHLLRVVQQARADAANAVQTSVVDDTIAFSEFGKALMAGEDAAHAMGVTLRTDLVANLERAQEALRVFNASGIFDPVAFKALQDNIRKADEDLKNFGKTQDTFLSKSRAWRDFQAQIAGASHGVDQVKLAGVAAFDSLEGSVANAFSAIVMGQEGVGRALEQATAQSLSTIASQAAVKALFYTAEGFAALASFNGASASQFFTAAGEMAAVAVAAGAAGRGLAGAASGGGSSNTQQLHTSNSNTTSSAGGGTSAVGVQHFATGGLISAPTLAIMGEGARREAVLPLEDPQAMRTIGQAIGAQAGGGNIHVHVAGLISPDNLTKVVKQIDRMVSRNQVHLTSSNALRVTKRSA
jgi:hypothetical protein